MHSPSNAADSRAQPLLVQYRFHLQYAMTDEADRWDTIGGSLPPSGKRWTPTAPRVQLRETSTA
ncbi:MAG: hypothetical protein JW818_10265 [Pirellulales bacterium]|nr:hypothetical protein [Pirellulales bacterium]